MKRRYQEGSCLVTVMIIITLVSLLCLNVWRTVVLIFDISLQRQQYEQYMQPCHGIMLWALDACKKNFDYIFEYAKKKKKGALIEIPAWSINHRVAQAELLFAAQQNNEIVITARVFDANSQSSLHCCMTKNKKNEECVYQISKWEIHKT